MAGVFILDSDGAVVLEYKYNAWGEHKVLSPEGAEITDETHLGYLNPHRYRGYYYSDEMGLYYLKSRFYDPVIGRFISADSLEYLDPHTVGGVNLYAYCNNNPVMNVDPSGHFWDYLLDIGFLLWSIADVYNNPGDWKNWVALGIDALFAVVPFVPSGIGQVIKAGNKIDNTLDVANAINKVDNIQDVSKVTMIGRDMKRVKGAANLIDKADDLYKVWKGYDVAATGMKKVLHDGISAAHNGSWLFGKLRQGYTIIDIGLSTIYDSRGLWYGMERFVLGLWQTRNIWKLLINYIF